jgi:hypothetical protein
LIYRPKAGPNRIFYFGIIRALDELLDSGYLMYSLKVMGDCEPVIEQLKGNRCAIEMKDLYEHVRLLEDRLRNKKRAQVEYEYLNEDDGIYRKIDQCAKRSRAFIRKSLF